MPSYECEICNFSTKLKTDFRRHLKTRKHEKKLNDTKTFMECEPEKNLLSAQFCSKNLKKGGKNLNSAQFCSKNLKNGEKNLNSAHFCSKNLKKNLNSAQFCSNFDEISEKKTYFSTKREQNLKIDNSDSEEELILEVLSCDYCDYKTTRNSNLKRHIISCKNRLSEEAKYKLLYEKNEAEKQGLIQHYEQEKQILYKQIDKLLEKVGHTTNNIQNNLILNNFGKEDLSHITNSFKNQLLKGPFCMIPKMIEAVHTKPENKNILLPNKKEPYVKVFENAAWKFKDRKEIVKDLVDANYNRLDEYYETDGERVLNNVQINRYKNFQDKYDNYDPEIHEKLLKDSELVLLNQKNQN
jgi:hypothetical protein